MFTRGQKVRVTLSNEEGRTYNQSGVFVRFQGDHLLVLENVETLASPMTGLKDRVTYNTRSSNFVSMEAV